MKLTDTRGLPVSTQSTTALEHYELAARQTHGYFGNPLATLEQVHVVAAVAWMEGRFDRAAQLYGAIALEHPRDLVALQTAHLIDFYLGDSLMLRDRLAAAMPAWSAEMPEHGYFLGMYAFGLEETANYGRAEDVGRHALDLNPRDPWAVHAVQHVFEMQGRVHDCMQWLQATSPTWSASALSFHNWWHLALHHLELDDIESALAGTSLPTAGQCRRRAVSTLSTTCTR